MGNASTPSRLPVIVPSLDEDANVGTEMEAQTQSSVHVVETPEGEMS